MKKSLFALAVGTVLAASAAAAGSFFPTLRASPGLVLVAGLACNGY